MKTSRHVLTLGLVLGLVIGAAGQVLSQVLSQEGPPAVEESPIEREDSIEDIAPRTELDWRALEDLDAQDYVERLAVLDAMAVDASRLVLDRAPRERTGDVASGIVDAHEYGRALAEELLPQADPDTMRMPADAEHMDAVRGAQTDIVFEEAYIDAMIAAHREAIALTSHYRRFGSDENVREFARRVLPILESSLYRAVTIRQELVAEFVEARGAGG